MTPERVKPKAQRVSHNIPTRRLMFGPFVDPSWSDQNKSESSHRPGEAYPFSKICRSGFVGHRIDRPSDGLTPAQNRRRVFSIVAATSLAERSRIRHSGP